MKLPFYPPKRTKVACLWVSLLAGAGVANAQFTGIGTTAPAASLHVVPVTPGTDEPLQVESVIGYNNATDAAYTDVLRYDPATGLFRTQAIADLLDENGEWVFDGTTLSPRNLNANTIDITNAGVGIGVATTINNDLGVNGDATVTGNATVGGNVAVTGTSVLGGQVTLGSVAAAAPVPAPLTTEVLVQDAAGVVQFYTVEDLIAASGEWVFNTATNVLEPRRFPGTLTIDAATLTVAQAALLQSTLEVDGAAQFDAAVTMNVVNTIAAADIDDADRVLVQQDGSQVVENVTVADLIASNAEFRINAAGTRVESSRFGNDINFDADDLAIGIATDINSTLDVTGNATLDADLAVTGNTGLTGTLSIGDVAEATTAGSAPGPIVPLDEILMQRPGTDLVEYVTVQDLLASNGEWIYDAANTRIYARRAQAAGSDIWATDAGNFVIETGNAFQWGDATNQINNLGLTVTAGYTVTNGVDGDFAFQEAGSAAPWLFHDADAAASGEIGRVGINTNAPQATLHVAGNIVASNTAVTSDKRFKKDITEIHGALKAVNALRGVSYGFRSEEFPGEHFDDATHIGLIAQEVREVLPQVVFERADGFLTVDYSAVTPVLVEAVQELSAKVAALQTQNAALAGGADVSVGAVSTKQIRDLEARLAAMDARLDEVTGRK